jgi:Tol biopolymer transport system component
MLTKAGAKLLDFGLSKLRPSPDLLALSTISPDAPLTAAGAVLGTYPYMAPEQLAGREADSRSDIFALGAIVYEMATGRRAFEGTTAATVIGAILHTDPPAVSSLQPLAPPLLDRIVARCLAKDPDDRWQSARDLMLELKWIADQAHRPDAVQHSQSIRGASASLSPRLTRLTFDRGTIRAARFAFDGKTVLYGASWTGQPIKIFQTRVGRPESTPFQLPDADVLSVSSTGEVAASVGHRFRGWIGQGTLVRAPLVGGSFREVLDDVRAADWSPDGKELAIVRRVHDKDRLEYPIGTVLYETPGYISHLRVSPSGDMVTYQQHPVFGDNRGCVGLVTRTGQRRTLTREWSGEDGLAWSRDGREIWFAASEVSGRNILFAVTLDGALRQIWTAPADLTLLDVGPDGHVLATANTIRTEIKWMSVDDAREREISWYAWSFAKDLSPDGKTVLLTRFDEGAGFEYQIGLRQIDASGAVLLGEGTPSLFSPDQKWVVAVMHSQPGLFLLPTGVGERRTLTRPGFRYITAGCTPDGKRIIFAAQENDAPPAVYMQDVTGGMPMRVPIEIPPLLASWGLRVSPDGSWFFGAHAAGPPLVFPVSGGRARVLNGLSADDLPVAWTSDSRAILIVRRSDDQMSAVIVRFDFATGHTQVVRQVNVVDKSGGRGLSCLVTPDGRTVVYNVARYLTDLYLVEGLE